MLPGCPWPCRKPHPCWLEPLYGWHSITVSAADTQTTHRRDAAGNVVTRSRVPVVPDGVEFVVEAVVERVGPECGVLLPATALTDVRLLRPTRLTAANAEIRQLAGTMADQDTSR